MVLLAVVILLSHRFSGGIDIISAANRAWACGSTGLCLTLMLAGSLPR